MRDDEIAEVREATFPIALRGYDRDAVDSYVERVNELIAELQMGRSPRSAVKHALDQVGEETRGILERAHDTADEITARSRAQAEDRLEVAEREARAAIDAASTRVRVLDTDADEIWQERKRLLDDARRIAADLTALADDAERRFPAEPSEEDEEDTEPLRVPIDTPNSRDANGAEVPPVPEAEADDLDELPPPPPPAPAPDEDRRSA